MKLSFSENPNLKKTPNKLISAGPQTKILANVPSSKGQATAMNRHSHHRIKSWHNRPIGARESPRVNRRQFFEGNSRTTDEQTSQTARFPHSTSQRGNLLMQGTRDETPSTSSVHETTKARQSCELHQQGAPAQASSFLKDAMIDPKLHKVSERRSR